MPRLNAQRFFLTYSQADLSIDDLADFLFNTHHPSWLEVANEQHADGGQHFHVVIVFPARFQGQMGCFDFEDHHPNIQTIKHGKRDIFRVRHYIRKEEKAAHSPEHNAAPCDYTGEPLTRGDVPPYSATTECLDYGAILDRATDSADFLKLVRQHRPADFVLRNDAIEQFASHHFNAPSVYVPKYAADSFVVPAAVDEWMEQVFSEVSCVGNYLGAPSPEHLFLIELLI